MKSALFLLSLFLSLFVSAQNVPNPDSKIKYDKALSEYQAERKNGTTKKLIPYAKALYEASLEYLEDDDIGRAVLAQNYAAALNLARPNEDSIPLLKYAIESYRDTKEPQTENLINALFDLGKVYNTIPKYRKKVRRNFLNALELAEERNDKVLLARTQLKIGVNYISSWRLTKKQLREAMRLITAAQGYFKSISDEREVVAAFWLGKANMINRNQEKAIEHFSSVLDKPRDSKRIHKLAMSSHAFLVDAYSKNDQPEKATEHCRAIGKVTPWSNDKEIEPIYILQPRYPRTAARSGAEGWVKTKFTIDSDGFAKDIEVVDSEGHSSFSKAALKVLPKWRFAPKYENGEPVEGLAYYTLYFKMGK